MCIHMYMCIYLYVHVYMCVYVYTHMYMHALYKCSANEAVTPVPLLILTLLLDSLCDILECCSINQHKLIEIFSGISNANLWESPYFHFLYLKNSFVFFKYGCRTVLAWGQQHGG